MNGGSCCVEPVRRKTYVGDKCSRNDSHEDNSDDARECEMTWDESERTNWH